MSRGDVRNIHTGDEVRQKAIEGAKIVYDAVATAYSPVSGNVALEKSYGSFVVSHDGVSIARDIVIKDKQQDIGADLLIQASSKSNDTTGDGTTVTILLGYHIMAAANKRIAAGYNPMLIRRGIHRAASDIKAQVAKLATPVKDEDLAKVATISASDPAVGALVADTMLKVGGVGITIEEFDGLGVIQETIEGLYFEKGWEMEHFVTDKVSEEVVHEDCSIVILEKRITANQDVLPILEMLYEQTDNKTVLIIGNVGGAALETCALTNIAGKIKICAVSPPVYGDQVAPFLEDIAVVTGGKLIPTNMPSDQITMEYIGHANKVIVTKGETTIIEGSGAGEDVEARIAKIQDQLKSDKYSSFQKERMEKRLAKLQGKIGIIKVGGATESEIKEMKFRVEDALHATRAAREDGIVPGGAVTLARLSAKGQVPEDLSPDEAEGYKLVFEVLSEPFKQLMTNAGEDGGYRLSQVLAAKKSGQGFDVKNMTDQPVDLITAGVIDPAKVLKSAIENACSVAGILVTLQGSILIDREYQLEQVAITRATQ